MPFTGTPTYFQIQSTPVPMPPPKKEPVEPPRKPLLRLEIRDLDHPGSKAFLHQPDAADILSDAVYKVLNLLYGNDSKIPAIRSITLVLRDMEGVAYTTGSDIDEMHKEIHFSTRYINNQTDKVRQRKEILGVICHEMVHVWQWNAYGSCDGGLIEGIADWVRLNAGLGATHWQREWSGDWNGGYQKTAYFLDWLEDTIGKGTVVKINAKLRGTEYKEEPFWRQCCGKDVDQLWKEYGKAMQEKQDKCDNPPAIRGRTAPTPTECEEKTYADALEKD